MTSSDARFTQLALFCLSVLSVCDEASRANPPVASYIFPAGGRRGTTVDLHVGGLFLHKACNFELLGPGVESDRHLTRTKALWFEGPFVPLPESQETEDYPKDMAGRVRIAADAALGVRHGRLWTAHGASSGLKFMVGDLPEVVEHEIDGAPIPVTVHLPVTINGRIFPRENLDIWSFAAQAGATVTCEVQAARLGSPLDAYLEVRGPAGDVLAENDDAAGPDARLQFRAPVTGTYQVRIRDVAFKGGPAFVYRLTVTADPFITSVYPLGGRHGARTHFLLQGEGLPREPIAVDLPAAGAELTYQHAADGKRTNPVVLDLDDLPEHWESEPNDTPSQARLVPLPAVLNGRIDRPGDVDAWTMAVAKGETVILEMRAALLGSRLQAVVTIADGAGKELGRAESNGATDPILSFTASAGGVYAVRIADRFKGRGGRDFAYRLRVTTPIKTPDFHLDLGTDVLTLPRGGKVALQVKAQRRGAFLGPIQLTLDGLPSGVKAAGATVLAGQNQATIELTADKAAPITAGKLTVRGNAPINGQPIVRTAACPTPRGTPPIDSVLVALALPCPFRIVAAFDMRPAARGTVFRRKYRIERHGFRGPIEIGIADRQARHLQGAAGPLLVVPPGQNEFEYPVFLPPWMEVGRTSRVCIQGVAEVKDGDTNHEVSFSAITQDDQVVTVMETGRLDLATDKSNLVAAPGSTITLPVRVIRGRNIAGAAKVELVVPDHIRGVAAEPISIPAGQSAGVLLLRFAANELGPFNMPATLRATVVDPAAGPVVAETKIELLEAR